MVDLVETRLKLRSFVVLLFRAFFRSMCNHPFLVGVLFFLIFLSRSFSLRFSFLVSTSPTNLNTDSTRVEPEPDKKPMGWVRFGIDRLKLGLGSTQA